MKVFTKNLYLKILIFSLVNVFDTLPKQLMKENKKFQYSLIRKGATNKIYEKELELFKKAMDVL